MDYRKRIYDTFISTHWQYTRHFTLGGYEYDRKVFRRRFAPFLPKDKNAKIIDLACGAGHFLYFLQKEGYSQTQGIDLSHEQVDVARQMGVTNVEVGDIFELLPRYNEEFDFISANQAIEHLKKDEVLEFLDLVYAALKPGGMALMVTPNAASLFGARYRFVDFTHEIGFTSKSLAQVFRVAGFEDVMVRGEEPVAVTLTSAVRVLLWKLLKVLIKSYLAIEGSISYKIWKREAILEPCIFVVGRKPGG